MKFALVNGQRREAEPDLLGKCPIYDHPMVAKCGEVKVWHWAHLGSRSCDPWWESETEWHRAWKGKFPDYWQEVVHQADDGEKHIADVKTDRGWVIEFQHSHIGPEERRSRDTFYTRIIWVVDGLRRKRDEAQFLSAWEAGRPVNQYIRRVFSNECTLLREWASSPSPVFFDFGGGKVIWWVFHKSDGQAYVMPFSHSDFVAAQRGAVAQMASDFDELVKNLSKLAVQYESLLRSQAPQPIWSHRQFSAQRVQQRKHFRF